MLCVCDLQNLDLSARDLGYNLSWAKLGQTLSGAAERAFLHAVYSRDAGDPRQWD